MAQPVKDLVLSLLWLGLLLWFEFTPGPGTFTLWVWEKKIAVGKNTNYTKYAHFFPYCVEDKS